MNKMSLKCKRNRHVQCNLKLRSVFQYFFIICIILNFRSLWLHTETFSWMARFVKVYIQHGQAIAVHLNKYLVIMEFILKHNR